MAAALHPISEPDGQISRMRLKVCRSSFRFMGAAI
jgi:hypothetical protein